MPRACSWAQSLRSFSAHPAGPRRQTEGLVSESLKFGLHVLRCIRSRILPALLAIMLGLSGITSFAHAADSSGITVQNQGDARPYLVFACDNNPDQFPSLFTPELIADLKSLGAGVGLSTIDFSPARTQLVQRLNAAGIPVHAGIALPSDQGGYANAGNAPQVLAAFNAFDQWSTENHLKWQAVGLDIEPNLSEFAAARNHKFQLIGLAVRRAFDGQRVVQAREAYTSIIRQMQSRGYSVETYQFPLIADERRAHSTVLERLLGIVNVRGNDEALMVYTSFNHRLDSAMIWEYGPDAQAIAVGSTASSGDAATDAAFPPLNWDQFSRDLIVARHFSRTIGVYNLEGSVQQGFITRLKTVDWNERVVIPAQALTSAARLRRLAHVGLWLASRAIYIVIIVLLIFAWIVYAFIRRRRRKRMDAILAAPAA